MAIDYSGTMYGNVEGKPCPFCGCEEIRSYTHHHSGGWTTNVECSRCPGQMPSDNVGAALERWNTRIDPPDIHRVRAHMKQVEWENQQLLNQMEEVKRIFRTDFDAVKRDSKVAAVKFYEDELRLAQQRAAMMEDALTIAKKSMEEE